MAAGRRNANAICSCWRAAARIVVDQACWSVTRSRLGSSERIAALFSAGPRPLAGPVMGNAASEETALSSMILAVSGLTTAGAMAAAALEARIGGDPRPRYRSEQGSRRRELADFNAASSNSLPGPTATAA
jgi:hypothetical protein